VFVHLKDQQVFWKQDEPDQSSVRLKAIQLLQSGGCINRATGLINAVGLFEKGEENEINICIGNVQSGNGEPSIIFPETIATDTTQTVSMMQAMSPNTRQAGMSRRCGSIKCVAGVRSEK